MEMVVVEEPREGSSDGEEPREGSKKWFQGSGF
jgi:hypothetical protein